MFNTSLIVANVPGANRNQSVLNKLYTFTAIETERRGSLRENDAVDTLENPTRSKITFLSHEQRGRQEAFLRSIHT